MDAQNIAPYSADHRFNAYQPPAQGPPASTYTPPSDAPSAFIPVVFGADGQPFVSLRDVQSLLGGQGSEAQYGDRPPPPASYGPPQPSSAPDASRPSFPPTPGSTADPASHLPPHASRAASPARAWTPAANDRAAPRVHTLEALEAAMQGYPRASLPQASPAAPSVPSAAAPAATAAAPAATAAALVRNWGPGTAAPAAAAPNPYGVYSVVDASWPATASASAGAPAASAAQHPAAGAAEHPTAYYSPLAPGAPSEGYQFAWQDRPHPAYHSQATGSLPGALGYAPAHGETSAGIATSAGAGAAAAASASPFASASGSGGWGAAFQSATVAQPAWPGPFQQQTAAAAATAARTVFGRAAAAARPAVAAVPAAGFPGHSAAAAAAAALHPSWPYSGSSSAGRGQGGGRTPLKARLGPRIPTSAPLRVAGGAAMGLLAGGGTTHLGSTTHLGGNPLGRHLAGARGPLAFGGGSGGGKGVLGTGPDEWTAMRVCSLCNTKGTAIVMLDHVKGKKHGRVVEAMRRAVEEQQEGKKRSKDGEGAAGENKRERVEEEGDAGHGTGDGNEHGGERKRVKEDTDAIVGAGDDSASAPARAEGEGNADSPAIGALAGAVATATGNGSADSLLEAAQGEQQGNSSDAAAAIAPLEAADEPQAADKPAAGGGGKEGRRARAGADEGAGEIYDMSFFLSKCPISCPICPSHLVKAMPHPSVYLLHMAGKKHAAVLEGLEKQRRMHASTKKTK